MEMEKSGKKGEKGTPPAKMELRVTEEQECDASLSMDKGVNNVTVSLCDNIEKLERQFTENKGIPT